MSIIQNLAIIDDDNFYQYASKRIIQPLNLVKNFQIFLNGGDAIAHIIENSTQTDQLPDLIFLDLDMPIMDGWEFLEKFSAIEKDFVKRIPIYIFSSSTNPDDIITARQFEEVSDYMVKPVTEEVFLNIVGKHY